MEFQQFFSRANRKRRRDSGGIWDVGGGVPKSNSDKALLSKNFYDCQLKLQINMNDWLDVRCLCTCWMALVIIFYFLMI